ncbi:MAG: Gldg family protein, partial [Snowella sp.]
MQNFFQKIQPYLKYLKYFYLPGVFLTVAGAIAGITSGIWSSLYLGLMMAGAAFLLIWLTWLVSNIPNFLTRRSTQAGTNVLVGTIAILVIVGIINFLGFRFSSRIDFTENQLFTLSPQTQEIITNLKKPVKLWIFDSPPDPGDQDLLNNFRRYNTNFSFEFVNPDQKPSLVKTFNVKSQGDVYLEFGDKKQLVQTLINFNRREPLSEIKLINAIEKIQRDRILNVYFLQGHGERPLNTTKEGMSEAVNNLENKGFKVNPLNLVESSAIPDNTNAIIIAGPKRKLFEQEVTTLQKYADQGGSLFVMIDPETDPGLDPLLKQWGVTLDPRIIMDLSGTGSLIGLGPAAPVITTYGEHPITQEFGNGMSIFPLSRPIATVKTPNIVAVTLLEASDKMWAKRELTGEELVFDPKQDIVGPFDLGVALTRTEAPNQKVAPSPSVTTSPSPATRSQESPLVQPSAIPSVTPSLAPSPTVSPTVSPTISPSPLISPTPLTSPSPTPLVSPSPQPSISPQKTGFNQSPFSAKLVSYAIAQASPEISPSPTPSISPTASPSPLVSPSPTSASPSPVVSPSPAVSPTET